MTNVETKGYMWSYSTKSFQRINAEFINTILKRYCSKNKTVCSLGAYNDVLIDQIEYDRIFLVDKEFGDLKYKENGYFVKTDGIEGPKKEFKRITYFEDDIMHFLEKRAPQLVKVDVVLMTNVAEHLDYDEMYGYKGVCSNIKNILKPDGYFICTFPNFESVNRLVGAKLGIIDDPRDLDKHDVELGHKNPMTDWDVIEQIPLHSELKLVQEIGIYFKPLSHKQMDKYFSDCLDKFIQIGYDLGPRVCSYIGGVYKNESRRK